MKFYTMELDQLSEEKNDQVYIMPFQQSDIELHDHNFLELAYVTGGNAIQNFSLTTLIISKKPGNTGISRDIRTEFTTDLLLSD